MPDAETLEKQVRLTGDLTIPEFGELLTKVVVEALADGTRQKMIRDAKAEQDITERIFRDAQFLSAVVTPFRISSHEQVKKFAQSLIQVLSGQKKVVIAMAIVDSSDGTYEEFKP